MAEAEALIAARLPSARSTAAQAELARDLLALCDGLAEALHRVAPVDFPICAAGCDTCCLNRIQVRPMFAALAITEARRALPAGQFATLEARLRGEPTFCPLLFDGRCAIYAARPMVCRGYYSFDRRLCEQGNYCEGDLGYQGEDAHAAHQFLAFLFALEKRIEAAETACGAEPGPVYLDSALRRLLDEGEI